jgi:hypothetical protein
MGKEKFFLTKQDIKTQLYMSIQLYQAEEMLLDTAKTIAKINCPKCENVVEYPLVNEFPLIPPMNSLEGVMRTMKLFLPTVYAEIVEHDVRVMLAVAISFIRDEKYDIFDIARSVREHDLLLLQNQKEVAKNINPNSTPPKGIMEAKQIKDLLDKSKIIVTRTIPKS